MRGLLRAGHLPTLLASLLHFETSFMAWMLIGALGVLMAADLGLSPAEKGLVVGAPLLGGAIWRVPIGLLGDWHGAKRVGIATMLAVSVPLCIVWRAAADVPGLVVAGLLLGVAGSSFAVALPLASGAYPPKYQGTAMGIAAAGNSGAALAALVAPLLGEILGWRAVFGLAILPTLAVCALFALAARESARSPIDVRRMLAAFRQSDLWWFCLLYSMTFGGFSGLASFLAIYFHDEHGLDVIAAGSLVAACAVSGSLTRPIGGALSDRFGGVPILSLVFAAVPLGLAAPIAGLPLPVTAWSLLLAMAGLGIGNGAVFHLVPRRFGTQVGLATGVVGAAGGLGGFVLPVIMGIERELTGSYGPGLFLYAVSLGYMFLCLRALASGWRSTWLSSGPSLHRLAPDA